MTKDEALRLALEALENITSVSICEATHHAKKDRHLLCEECPNEVRHLKAITAIKAALEAKDEPVALAWAEGYRMGISDERTSEANIGIAGFNAKVEPARKNPYATTPPQQEAKDEPWEQLYPEMGKPYAFEASMYPRVIIDPVTGNVSIGTPQRTWVGLTNQELADCWDTIPERAMRQVEAKLKEKNT
jgi:hypothetical protein